MKFLFSVITALIISIQVKAHEMQHGFIISLDDSFFSHLVANGHHSHQLSFHGRLNIADPIERKIYEDSKNEKSYLLFQAQNLNLPATHNGQTLKGHIVESPVGDYTPENIIVKEATINIKDIKINVSNPFFHSK